MDVIALADTWVCYTENPSCPEQHVTCLLSYFVPRFISILCAKNVSKIQNLSNLYTCLKNTSRLLALFAKHEVNKF